MTKIKNTKKGMAKKTLSMSLVVAMLATSNVPVWAAEFSDGSDASVATEAPVVEDTATFTDDTAEAPVVDDTEAVAAQAVNESSDSYVFSNIKLTDDATNFSWGKFDGSTTANIGGFFKEGSVIVNSKTGATIEKNDYNMADPDLKYVFRYGNSWDESGLTAFNTSNLYTYEDLDLSKLDITVPVKDLRSNAGKTFDMLIVGKDDNGAYTKVVSTISFGTIQKVDLNTAVTLDDITGIVYNGLETQKQIQPTVKTSKWSDITGNSFNWTYNSTEVNYTDAGVKVTVTGKLKDGFEKDGFTDTITTSYVIGKKDLSQKDNGVSPVVVKLKKSGEEFEYQNNASTEIDKSEVDVSLRDFSEDDVVASGISLNDYVKKVTIDTTSLGKKVVNVEFDTDALKASKNFTKDVPSGVTSEANRETATKAEDTKVNVVALDLSKCEVSLKSPVQAAKTIDPSDISIVVTKNGKTINLKDSDYTKTVKSGDYSTPDTYKDAVTVSGTGNVTGSKPLDLVTVKQAFKNAKFEASNWTDYLAERKEFVYGKYERKKGLDYNNGKAVEFADMFTSKCVLGRFSPDGKGYGDQDNFRVTYENNVNATNADSVAKLTVTAIAGDYKGCSQDFYFKINPSTVNPTANSKTTTVTTNVAKDAAGIALNEANNDNAAGYADAIGLKVNGTSNTADPTNKDAITSNATTDDYTVEYSYVKNTTDAAGSNEVNNYVKAEITLKKNGNFVVASQSTGKLGDAKSSVQYKIVAKTADDNGKVILYVPIIDKSIDTLDISLKEDTFTFTGEQIKPEVIVKENGKVLKDAATIEGITDGINAGTATIKVSVKDYSGTKELKATINPAKLSDVVFEIKKERKEKFTYNGKQQKPAIAQEDDPTTTKVETILEKNADADVKLGSVVISKMFDIKYGENVNAGEKAGSVTLTPKALYAKNFDGTSLTADFEILRAVFTADSVADVLSIKDTTGKKVTIRTTSSGPHIDDEMDWTGDTVKFASVTINDKELTVTPAGTKFNDDDYELVYVNAVDATAYHNKAYVAVIGKGNFKGEYSIVSTIDSWGDKEIEVVKTEDAEKDAKENPGRITILQKDIIDGAWVAYDITGGEFNAKNITYSNGVYAGGTTVTPNVTVKDAKTGDILTVNKDYKIRVASEGYDTVNAGVTKIPFAIEGLGKYKNNYVSMKDGKQLTYSIDKKDLKDCTVSVDKNLKATVSIDNITETKENFDVKDNGDGTATVSVVDGGKNYTGSVNVEIGGRKVGAPMISNVKVVGNKATVILSDEVDGASGYDYVISTDKDCITNKDYTAVNKNQAKTTTAFKYVDKGTYYAYCHAWTRDANGKKVFGEWSNGFEFSVTATTPDAPVIKSVKVSGSTIKVKYELAANATGYDVVLGTSSKKDNGELRPYNYGAHKVLNLKEGTITATFKNVPAGTWTVGMHAFNRTSIDNKKVFSPWSNLKTAKVK